MKNKSYERPLIQKINTGVTNKIGTNTSMLPKDKIDGINVKDLMDEYGSPLFVISESKIRENIKNTLRAFKTRYSKVQFAWSYKTNYINAICNIFHQEGSWAEVVSSFEYEKAIKNGVPGNKIIFNGPDKSIDALKLAIKNKSLIHIDHFDELYTIIELANNNNNEKINVAIRVNMDTGVYPIWDRFGFNYENGQAWDAILKLIIHENIDFQGLHCHIGTYMLTTNAYSIAASKLCDLAFQIKKHFQYNIKYIDLGGGFASTNTLKGAYLQAADIIPTIDEYAEAITNTILRYGFKKDELPLLILETGRALIDNTAYLCGTVLANKRLSDGRRATIVDFGVNILFTAFWYNHVIIPAQEFSYYTEETSIFGPLCMNIDCIRESIQLPLLKKGDRVVVHQVGAYNMTQWLQFIHMRPNVVLIDTNKNIHIIRKNETINDIENLEKMPQHLKSINL